MDLSDVGERTVWRAHLGGLLRGRAVVCGLAPLAAYVDLVALLEQVGARRPLLVATGLGAGATPTAEQADVVLLEVEDRPTMTEDLRRQDAVAHALPDAVRRAVDAYDPAGEAVWLVGPFIGTTPIDGRPVLGGRPHGWTALEDKLVADEIWDAVGGTRAPSRIVALTDDAALREATRALDDGQGVVWSGDARDGFNGGGDFVRRVLTDDDARAALAFFGSRCDRVRVMPFLDGVPCSIHGIVLPDGTAVLRPVELAILRGAGRRFVYGGLGTTWDPPDADRAWMRELARRTGDHLGATAGYRGAFGIDGVVTADGFRPTELNARLSGGIASMAAMVDAPLVNLLQLNLVSGRDPGVGAADLEAWLLPRVDAARFGKAIAMSSRHLAADPFDVHVVWDGTALSRSWEPTGWTVAVGPSSAGTYCRLSGPSLAAGTRVADLNVALMRFLDAEIGTGFGPVSAAPEARR